MKLYLILFIFPILLISCNNAPEESTAEENSTLNENEPEEEYVHIDREQGEEIPIGPVLANYDPFDRVYAPVSELIDVIESSDKIVAYNWNGNEGNSANSYHFMIRDGHIDKSAKVVKTLSEDETSTWLELVTDTTNYEEFRPMCFTPHIAFLYYQNDTVIGQSNVCFLCAAVFSQPQYSLSLNPDGTDKLKSFCQSLGLTIYDSYDQVSL